MLIFPKKCLLYLGLLLSLVACRDEDPVLPGVPSFVETCCALPGLHVTVDSASVFLPNVFTPNGDGLNDFAVVYGTATEIEDFTIFKDDIVYFRKQNFEPNLPLLSWDGMTSTGYRNDYYSYSLTVGGENFQGTISSWLCNGGVFPDNILNCQHGSQFDGTGYSPNIASFENCN